MFSICRDFEIDSQFYLVPTLRFFRLFSVFLALVLLSSCTRAPGRGSGGLEQPAPSLGNSAVGESRSSLQAEAAAADAKSRDLRVGFINGTNTANSTLLSNAAATQALSGEAVEEDDHHHWELIGLGIAGSIYTTGLAVEAWRRYVNGIRPQPEHHGSPGPDGAASQANPGAQNSAQNAYSGSVQPETGTAGAASAAGTSAPNPDSAANYAAAEANLARALDQLFREAESLAANAAPESDPLFEFGREQTTGARTVADSLAVPRSALTSLLTRIAAAQDAATEAVVACAHCADPRSVFPRGPQNRIRQTTDSAPPARASAYIAWDAIATDPARDVVQEMLSLLQEPGDAITLSWRQKAWAWLRATAANNFDLLYRRAPAATLNFFEDPRNGTRRGIGWSANLIGANGAIPGSLIVTGIVPWFILFESTMDPFHAWCALAIPMYLGAANNILQTVSSLRTGQAYRGEEIGLGERLAHTRALLSLRREVERKRRAIVLRTVASGLSHGFKKNRYLKQQNERLEVMPEWISHLAQSRLWADFVEAEARASLAGVNSVSSSAPAPLPNNRVSRFSVEIFSPAAVQQNLFTSSAELFRQTLDAIFTPSSSPPSSSEERRRIQTERGLRWSGLIAEMEEVSTWLSIRTDLLAETGQITNSSYYRLKWHLGRITARMRRLELLGYLQIQDPEAATTSLGQTSFTSYRFILERTFNLLRSVHEQLSAMKQGAEASQMAQSFDTSELASGIEALGEQIQAELRTSRDLGLLRPHQAAIAGLPDQRSRTGHLGEMEWILTCQARVL